MPKKGKNFRKQLQEIRIPITEVLKGEKDLLSYNVNEAITKIKSIREQLKNEALWNEGISTLKLLFRIRKKQDMLILKIISGELEYTGSNYSDMVFKYLENEDLLKSIGNRLYRTLKINQTLPNLDLNYNKDLIFNSAKNSFITIEKEFPEAEFQEIEIQGEVRSKKFKETLNSLYKILKKNQRLPLLETILTHSFLETFLRIQCISYLFQYSYVKLISAEESERARAGRWMIVDSNAIPDFKEENKDSSSIIIGLSYNNWKKLQPFLEKNQFENRPLIPTID